MSDVATELLSVTLTRAPLGLKLDAYGFLAAVLDTAEDATRRALRPCDELIGINGTLYDDIPTESTPDAAAELCDLVGEYVEAGAFPLTLTFRRDPSLMCQPVGACFERRSVAPPPHVALDAEPEAPPDAHLVSFADLRVSDVVVVAVVRAAAGRR